MLRCDAKRTFYIADQELEQLQILEKPSRKNPDASYDLKHIRRVAFEKYGGKAEWYKVARDKQAKAEKLKVPKDRIRELRTRKLNKLLDSEGMDPGA